MCVIEIYFKNIFEMHRLRSDEDRSKYTATCLYAQVKKLEHFDPCSSDGGGGGEGGGGRALGGGALGDSNSVGRCC